MKKLLILFGIITILTFPVVVYAQNGLSDEDDSFPPAGKYRSVEEVSDKNIGVMTGSSFDAVARDMLPEAKARYYNSMADMITAIKAGKIDAFLADEPVIRYLMADNEELTFIPETFVDYDFAYAFPKNEEGQKLCDEISEYTRRISSDGTLNRILDTWFGRDEENWGASDYEHLPASNGTLTMAVDATTTPFIMLYNGKLTGIEVDIAAGFCEEYGYGLEIKNMSFDAVLPAIQTGKADFVGAGLAITPERAESVLFSEPHYTGGIVLAVLKADAVTETEDEDEEAKGLWDSIRISFEKTFIREQRWRMFLRGLLTTLTITLISIILGSLLGFGVYMLCRNGNRVANGITGVCTWLVQGMPTVVLLMIFYYIIFGKLAIGGVWVAVICFTLIFAAAVFALLKMGVGAVDKGQYEAACALGYSETHTFFRVILPQALPHVMPSYKGEITGLLKATSVVGYIAVQDLTKMGDLVRSRTYEAFFPLIAVGIIYFMLEGLLGFMVNRLSKVLDPKRRKNEDILKGVNADDKD